MIGLNRVMNWSREDGSEERQGKMQFVPFAEQEGPNMKLGLAKTMNLFHLH